MEIQITPATQEDAQTLHEQFGLSPQIAALYLSKILRGTIEEASATRYDENYSGFLAAMVDISRGDQQSYLLEEVVEAVNGEREGLGLRTRFNSESRPETLRGISRRLRTVYGSQITSQNGRVRS